MVRKIQPEVYSRVTGYFRPVSQYNKGKQEEFKDRHVHHQKEFEQLNTSV
jgi:anaerobic ribonucleoside-triphosphate reductase